MRKRKKLIISSIVFIILIAAFVVFELYISKHWLTTSYYEIYTDKLTDSIRVVQITDLHNSEFGEGNSDLIGAVAVESPDLILITGDLVDSRTASTNIATDLIIALKKIAPVYFSFGNQEYFLHDKEGIDITQRFTEAGAEILEYSYKDITVNGQDIRLGGIYGYCQTAQYSIETHREKETEFLIDFQNTDNYKMLMCHMPYAWLVSGSLNEWDVDAVLAGHIHGGQVRIPLVGGLYAPDQGWFPGKVCGIYSTDEESWRTYQESLIAWAKENNYDISYLDEHSEYVESSLILSRGLGNTDGIPRFNNIPEVLVVDFIPSK